MIMKTKVATVSCPYIASFDSFTSDDTSNIQNSDIRRSPVNRPGDGVFRQEIFSDTYSLAESHGSSEDPLKWRQEAIGMAEPKDISKQVI